MDKKHFWQSASNWGFLGGAALFVVNLIGWGLKLETAMPWVYELLLLVVIAALIVVPGRRNAIAAGDKGYTYGQAVSFIFATMLFAGIVYGVGRFLMTNFIALDYYSAMYGEQIDKGLLIYQSTPMFDQMLEMRDRMVGWMRNPFFLIFAGVWEMVFKGGFLGLIVAAFLTRRPNIFAEAPKEK